MNIKDVPGTWRRSGEVMDAYEAERFGYDAGSVAVADATLSLMASFPPQSLAPAWAVRRFALSLMDDALLDAFGYAHPTRLERLVVRGALRLRARCVATRPARAAPSFFRDMSQMRSHPDGYDVAALGTFPCPHGAAADDGPAGWQAAGHDESAAGDVGRPA